MKPKPLNLQIVLITGMSGSAAFGQLMSALQTKFGPQLVTAAVPASPAKITAGNYGAAAAHLDWFNVMAYDYFGAWASSGPTAAHSPLTDYVGIPVAGLNSQATVAAYRAQGVPAAKILLGVPAYGRGWAGVSQTSPGGSATGPALGTWAAGVEDYKVLAASCPPVGTIGGAAYAHCGTNWWSFDTPATLASKAMWARTQGLGGTVMWELSGDTANADLSAALWDNR